jgi:NADH-quinone oxidoreductase subunit H
VFNVGNLINCVVFVVKAWLLVFVMMWVRWTLPRLRIDQVMMTCLKYLLPISCFLLLGVSIWQVAVQPVVGPYFGYALGGLSALLVLLILFKLLTTTEGLPVGGVASPWSAGTPGRPLAGKQ